MYVNPHNGLGSHRGLGEVVLNCDDAVFRFMYPGVCAAPAPEPTYTPPPEPAPAPAPAPVVYPEPTVDAPTKEPLWVGGGEIITEAEDFLRDAAPEPEATVISIGSGGWGAAPESSVTVQAGDVLIEADEPGGFGLLEAAIGAGLAWVLASSYTSRRRKR